VNPKDIDSPEGRGDFNKAHVAQLRELGRRMHPFGLDLDESRKHRLLRYAERVAQRAKEFNLVSKGDLETFVEKHIGSCLGPLLLLDSGPQAAWIDIGTGAGLPGLVLKLWEPTHPVLLVESSGKRCLFLEETARILGVEVEVLQKRGEELDPGNLIPGGAQGGFHGNLTRAVLMRAVNPLEKAVTWVPRILRPGDRWYLFAGPDWAGRVAGAAAHLDAAGLHLETCLEIPWAPGRVLVLHKTAAR